MSSNRLKLNPTKTEFMWLATSRRLCLIDHSAIDVAGAQIVPSSCVKLLGVNIDEDISMGIQISKTVSSGFYYLRQIKSVRRHLQTDAATSLVIALVVSRLDYYNSIYAGLPRFSRTQLDRLQIVFNAAARLIFGLPRSVHITPLLRDRLHWLRVPERVTFKLCVIVFQALHGTAPAYLKEMCVPSTTTERRATLRSATSTAAASTTGRIDEPKRTTRTLFGERAFAVAGPAAWNSLPADVRITNCFKNKKKQLKTHLFSLSFNVKHP